MNEFKIAFSELVNPQFRKGEIDCPFCKRRIEYCVPIDLISWEKQYKILEQRYVELSNKFQDTKYKIRDLLCE